MIDVLDVHHAFFSVGVPIEKLEEVTEHTHNRTFDWFNVTTSYGVFHIGLLASPSRSHISHGMTIWLGTTGIHHRFQRSGTKWLRLSSTNYPFIGTLEQVIQYVIKSEGL